MAIREVITTTIDDHPALASTLERGLIEEREKQIQGLMSSKDWPDFEKRRGLVNGLNTAIGIYQDVKAKLQG